MKKAFLKWFGPGQKEQVYPLTAEEILIGRKSDADLVLTDPYISRRHARLVRRGDDYELEDLKSTHGSMVNGQQVERHSLQHGDRVVLGKGRVEMTFLVDTPHQPDNDTTVDSDRTAMLDLTAVLPSVYSGYSDLEKLSFILDFQYSLGSQFSAESTFAQILASALKISGAERGFILLRANGSFDYVLGMDGDGRPMRESEFVQASRTVVSQVADSGEGVFMTEGIDGDLAQQDSIVAMNLRALACMPLEWISAESESDTPRVEGILYLDSTKPMHTLTGLDQKILNKLATEAANVFEKVQMIETLEERKQLEKELALAQETQRTLLPQSLPQLKNTKVLAFSEPTRYVGGDFYDFFRPEEGKLTGVLADVSGKGISAALLSSLLQGALDMQVRTGVSPANSLTRINRFLCERSQSNRFVTLFLFTLDEQGKGEFISAGHNPAYLYRAATAVSDTLESKHMILGAFDFATYSAAPLEMQSGDILLVYSDGLTEAENPAGEMFGTKRLEELILQFGAQGVEALKEAVLDAIEKFTEGHHQTDDITLVLVEKG